MTTMLQHSAAVLFLCASITSAQIVQEPITVPLISPYRVSVPSIGSVAAGCSLCRDSGTCSIAMDDASSGVFCGDIHATAVKTQPCCCAYYTECRATSNAQTCECGGAWPFALRHERLSATEAVANETESLVRDSFTPEVNDPMDNQMSVTTEILIHLSAYLALFVFAVYVDQWVECFSDFRRNQMVTYAVSGDTKLLRFRQRFGKRRQDSHTDTETDDNLPLLVLKSPTPTARPTFTFDAASDAGFPQQRTEKEEQTTISDQVVVVTVPVDIVQEVSISPHKSPTELEVESM